MEDRILQFIFALRASGVRISLAESIDAFRSVEELGVKDRGLFRSSLQATLIKDSSGLPVFHELFPQYFSSDGSSGGQDLGKELSEEEARNLDEMLQSLDAQLRQIINLILQGRLLPRESLEAAGRRSGLQAITEYRQRDWAARRMQASLRFREVEAALAALLEALAREGVDLSVLENLDQGMGENFDRLKEQIASFVGERIAEQNAENIAHYPLDDLYNRHFQSLTEEDMRILRQEVCRLAARLKTRIALRQKRSRNGSLDIKGTIRANLKHGTIPMVLKHRDRRLQPSLVVICDLSTSMRHLSELMLSLLYHLQDVVSKTHAFAFIDHLVYISPAFENRQPVTAVDEVLNRMPSGYYNTDLGRSLEGFLKTYLDTLGHRTSLIMIGDARNNFNNPRADLFRMMAMRSNRTIWINPEHQALWGSGDSDMPVYAPYCDYVLRVNNLFDLSRAVDRLFG